MNARCLVAAVLILCLAWPVLGEEQGQPAAQVAKPDAAAVAQWRKQLGEWRKLFPVDGPDHQALWDQGRASLAAIEDPAAVPAIVALLKTEKHGQFRRALIVPLINLGGKEAEACLVKWSVEDENPLLREEAAKGLVGREGLDAHLDAYIAYLKSPRFVANAAEALLWTKLAEPRSQSEKPNEKLTKALINAIHTMERRIVPYQIEFDTGRYWTPTIGSRSGINRVFGTDTGMVQVKIPVPQPQVVAALQLHTGQSYEYDQSRWRVWLNERLSR